MRWVVLLVLAGCSSSGHGAGPDGGSNCTGAATVSFKTDVMPLIDHCGGELCHGGLGPSWPYAAIVNKPTSECTDHRMLVAPGDPANSYLMQKLEGTNLCMGERMPRGGPYFKAADLKTINDWICNGAPNN